MTASYVLLQNLKRNRVRSGLTLLAFALPMAIFVAAISLVVALVEIGLANEKELRLAVHHKTTIINRLPNGHRRAIESLDPERKRLTAVCGMQWFGGKIPNEKQPVQSLAADPDTFPIVYSDAEMSPEDVSAWVKDRLAAVVGYGVCDTYKERYTGWEKGGRVTLKSTIPPYLELEFHIVKVMTNEGRANAFYFRRDYLTEKLKEAGVATADECNIFWIKCNGVEAMRSLQLDIDQQFANSPNETKSEDESAFAAGFTQALGNLPGLMNAMAMVVVVIIALVAGNTMMMSFRERTRELAVFKAVGFSNGRIFRVVLGESVLMALIGALLGVVPTCAVLMVFPVRQLGFLPISALKVSPVAVALSLVIALLVGFAAGLWPAYQALRLRTVDALRRIA